MYVTLPLLIAQGAITDGLHQLPTPWFVDKCVFLEFFQYSKDLNLGFVPLLCIESIAKSLKNKYGYFCYGT